MKRLLLLIAVLVTALSACAGSTATVSPTTSAMQTVTAPPSQSPASAATTSQQGTSGLPTVELSQLPPEAQETYELVLDGGPFQYRQDDQVFGNREGLLPPEDYGWYREYTIPTPGSPDRGAQRFVVGDDDVFFYTDDHYNSFSEVIE